MPLRALSTIRIRGASCWRNGTTGLERLANMRRELGFLPTPGDRAIVPGDRATSTRLANLRV
jgi:hypothetical protein